MLIFHVQTIFVFRRNWEKELAKARNVNRKPHLRNALFKTFYMSCIVDGFLVLLFTLLKSIMPVFLGQLLYQFQAHRNSTMMDLNETTTKQPFYQENNDENIWQRTTDYMVFIW
jgi:hypothetical protein